MVPDVSKRLAEFTSNRLGLASAPKDKNTGEGCYIRGLRLDILE